MVMVYSGERGSLNGLGDNCAVNVNEFDDFLSLAISTLANVSSKYFKYFSPYFILSSSNAAVIFNNIISNLKDHQPKSTMSDMDGI